MTTGKTIALTRRTFVGKVMSLLFNMLSRFSSGFNPSSTIPCVVLGKSASIRWGHSPFLSHRVVMRINWHNAQQRLNNYQLILSIFFSFLWIFVHPHRFAEKLRSEVTRKADGGQETEDQVCGTLNITHPLPRALLGRSPLRQDGPADPDNPPLSHQTCYSVMSPSSFLTSF